MIWLHKIVTALKKFYYLKILKKKYYRTGKCNCCGACCEKIYVKHASKIIDDEEFFYKLKEKHDFYNDLVVIDKDETGLVFACSNLDRQTRLCKNHKNREPICRKYPTEDIFTFGASLSDDCGFKFTPIVSFQEVLDKVISGKKENKNIKFFVE